MTGPRLHFTAGEASSDLLGREVIEAVRTRAPSAEIKGVGGSQMASVGASSAIDISPLSVLGLVEGLRAYGDVVRIADETAAEIIAFNPDVAVLVDSWGFTLRVARRVREQSPSIRLVKLVGPQIWATRPGRARTLARCFDQVLCIHGFEKPYYAGLDIEATTIGNPALDRVKSGDGVEFRDRMGFSSDDPVLLLAPGSRPAEIERVGSVFIDAAAELAKRIPELRVVAMPAPGVRAMFEGLLDADNPIRLAPRDVPPANVLAGATAALACSGTVTTELAVQNTPFVVGYKLGWITWAIARSLLLRSEYVTLLNVAAGREIAPEFIQTRLRPNLLVGAVHPLLNDRAARKSQIVEQAEALKQMKTGAPAAERAADAILAGLTPP